LYGVPIYFSLWCIPEVKKDYEKNRMLLWVPQTGFTQEGIDSLAARAQKWYDHKIQQATLQLGDRVFIKDKGIAIVYDMIEGKSKLRLKLFNQLTILADYNQIRWSVRNNRWETDQKGYSVSLRTTGWLLPSNSH
jgi:hypothetical protein